MPGNQVEFSHNVIFDEAVFPGISTDMSVDSYTPDIPFEEEVASPVVRLPVNSNSSEAIVSSTSSSADDQDEADNAGLSFSTAPEGQQPESQPQGPSSRRPGWDWVPADEQPPKHISSDIDQSNIISSKRRANVAVRDRSLFTNEPWYKPVAMTALSPANPLDDIPKTYRQAMQSPESELWTTAIQDELNAMTRLDVWEIVPITKSIKLLGTVWVFRRKYDADGNPIKLKARLCAQGNAQEEGVNFTDTYAPTGRAAALRTALTIGLQEGMAVHQMDVKNAFLNGTLDEVIHLRPPPGLKIPPGHCLD